MKSPLVEALRQANGETVTTDGSPSDVADANPPSPDLDPDSGTETAQDSAAIEMGESLEILPIEGSPTADAGDQDVELEESLDLAIADDEGPEAADANESEMVAATVVPGPVATQPSKAPRIGVYAPLLCVGVALITSASHFAYQWLGGRHENADLAVISAKDSESPGIPEHDSLLTPPTRFELVVGETAASAGDHPEERLRADLSEPGSTLP